MIQYKVKARLAINLGRDDFQLQEFEQVYTIDEGPIEARREAYSYYDSLLDVYFNAQAIEESSIFTSLYTSLTDYVKENGEYPSVLPENLGIGLYYFSNDEDLLSKQEDYFIMGYNESSGYHNAIKNLELEKRIYDLNNWDTQNWISKIKYYDLDKHTLKTIYVEDPKAVIFSEVLWCPTDFWIGDNPSAWAEDDDMWEEEGQFVSQEEEVEERKNEILKVEETFLSKIINQGENRNLEFKSTLRYCLETNKPEDYIVHGITKTIAAFANTEGGLLLIGVDDKGNLLGLDNDINSFSSGSKDSFLKYFDNLLNNHFTEPIDALLTSGFVEDQSRLIFMINVKKSSKPRFLIAKEKCNEKFEKKVKKFHIRRNASSPSLEIEDAVNYIISKWHTKD